MSLVDFILFLLSRPACVPVPIQGRHQCAAACRFVRGTQLLASLLDKHALRADIYNYHNPALHYYTWREKPTVQVHARDTFIVTVQ